MFPRMTFENVGLDFVDKYAQLFIPLWDDSEVPHGITGRTQLLLLTIVSYSLVHSLLNLPLSLYELAHTLLGLPGITSQINFSVLTLCLGI